jgi:hypothetical protein
VRVLPVSGWLTAPAPGLVTLPAASRFALGWLVLVGLVLAGLVLVGLVLVGLVLVVIG